MPTRRRQFVKRQLDKDTTTEQTYQFLGAAYRTYCPEKLPILTQSAGAATADRRQHLRGRRWRRSNSEGGRDVGQSEYRGGRA